MSLISVDHWKEVQLGWEWPHFTPMEMACRGTMVVRVESDFMDKLEELRCQFDRPMHLTSACRTTKHNDDEGGKSKSFHICDNPLDRDQLGCLAVDVATPQGDYRGQLFALAWLNGWSIGWNAKRGFLHLDQRIHIGWRQTTFDY